MWLDRVSGWYRARFELGPIQEDAKRRGTKEEPNTEIASDSRREPMNAGRSTVPISWSQWVARQSDDDTKPFKYPVPSANMF